MELKKAAYEIIDTSVESVLYFFELDVHVRVNPVVIL